MRNFKYTFLRTTFFVLGALIIVMFFTTCKKKDDIEEPIVPVNPSTEVVLNPNMKIIDSIALHLTSTQTDLENGIYSFQFSGNAPAIDVGSTIVGYTDDGYIRNVVSKNIIGNEIVFETSQGSLADVFKEGNFDFTLDMNSTTQVFRSSSGFNYTINNKVLYNNGPLNITLTQGNVNLDANWKFDFSFKNSRLNYFELAARNSPYSLNGQVQVTASGSLPLVNETNDTIAKFTKPFLIAVPGVLLPIMVRMDIYLIADYSALVDAQVSAAANFTSSGQLNFGMKYLNGSWQNINNINNTNEFTYTKPSGNVSLALSSAIKPQISFKLFGVAGPYTSFGPSFDAVTRVALPSLDWDVDASARLKATVGVHAQILDLSLINYYYTWESAKYIKRFPDSIFVVSGNNQTGQGLQQLPFTLKVKVVGNTGNAISNVPVYFNVSSGGGSVNPTSILTDANGFAECIWTLGPNQTPPQQVQVVAKKGDLTELGSSPLTFSATTAASTCPLTVTDIDGNTYNTVSIGTQCWMAENLNTSRYRNGDPIPTGLSDVAWGSATYGAHASPDGNSANEAVYGKLYNFYTISDSRQLCPSGWHVPTDAEWTTLVTFLGGENVAGGAMKEAGLAHWASPNTAATNSSGFTGLPGGYRGNDGSFNGVANDCYWWSSTESNTSYAWNRDLYYTSSYVHSYYYNKRIGFSVRCLRD